MITSDRHMPVEEIVDTGARPELRHCKLVEMDAPNSKRLTCPDHGKYNEGDEVRLGLAQPVLGENLVIVYKPETIRYGKLRYNLGFLGHSQHRSPDRC